MARLFSCFCTKIQASELLAHTILRRGVDFAFDLDAFSEIDEKANLYTGGFKVVDELGTVGRMQIFDGLEFEDYFVLYNNVGNIVADKLVVVMDLDLLFLFSVEANL